MADDKTPSPQDKADQAADALTGQAGKTAKTLKDRRKMEEERLKQIMEGLGMMQMPTAPMGWLAGLGGGGLYGG